MQESNVIAHSFQLVGHNLHFWTFFSSCCTENIWITSKVHIETVKNVNPCCSRDRRTRLASMSIRIMDVLRNRTLLKKVSDIPAGDGVIANLFDSVNLASIYNYNLSFTLCSTYIYHCLLIRTYFWPIQSGVTVPYNIHSQKCWRKFFKALSLFIRKNCLTTHFLLLFFLLTADVHGIQYIRRGPHFLCCRLLMVQSPPSPAITQHFLYLSLRHYSICVAGIFIQTLPLRQMTHW